MNKTITVECIVCGAHVIWFGDLPLPPACRHHTYAEILRVLFKMDDFPITGEYLAGLGEQNDSLT